ncbi:MAG: type II toxin-antitoxin system RelB/DinJ family antitoxin [Coriobacteriia bacterium]|nr:type II toxin-antitoxin system RelB/DinJ family antitoxin [Coriobacteriia bacterium]
MSPITAKLRPEEKQEFLRIAENIGTTPSNAIRMFVAAFNKRGGFPFDSANPYGFNDETLIAMRDAASGQNLLGPFDSTEDMWATILDGSDDA